MQKEGQGNRDVCSAEGTRAEEKVCLSTGVQGQLNFVVFLICALIG